MGLRNLFSLFFWLVSVSLSVVVSSQVCLDSFGTFKPGGIYDKNLQIILSSLASKVTAKDGFFNASIGTDPEKVYAMGMCIPGAKQKLCLDCIKDTSDQLLQTCPNQTAAFHWSGGGDTLCMRLLVRMVTEASSSSGKDVSVSNNRYYVADVAALTSFQMLYALMQCTPDVSPSNCKTCLQQSVDAYQSCCRGKQGGYVYWPNCIYRWDLYPFNGAFDLLKLEPPPSPQLQSPPSPQLQSPPLPLTNKDGKTSRTGTITGVVVAAVIIMALLALGLAICRRRKKYQAFTWGTADDITTAGYLQFDIKKIVAATSNFLASNKIGQGGFGEVYSIVSVETL